MNKYDTDHSFLQSRDIGDMLQRVAKHFSDRPALVVNGIEYSYETLFEKAALIRRGFSGTGKFSGLFGCRDFPIFAGIIASLCGGRTYSPVSPGDPATQQLDQIEQLRLDLILTDASDYDRLRLLLDRIEWPVRVILLAEDRQPDWCAEVAERHRFLALDDLRALPATDAQSADNPDAYLLFTSGSTGQPKGVLVSHANVLAYLNKMVPYAAPVATDRFSQLAPLSFDFSVHDIFIAWSVGATVYVFETGNPYQLAGLLRRERITICSTVPSTLIFFDRLHTLADKNFPDIRLTILCGEPLSDSVARQWQRAAPNSRIENMYGPTETTVAVTSFTWNVDHLRGDGIVPIGRAFDGVRLRIVDGRDQDVPEGETGELLIGGDQVSGGYWNKPDLTAQKFPEIDGQRWYRSGDKVRLDSELGLIYLGRTDSQIQVMGQRIDRLDVEIMLRHISGVGDVAVVPWSENDKGTVEGLVFFVDEAPGSEISLRQQCRSSMPRAMWPSKVIVGPLPKNKNGKTDYRKLQASLYPDQRGPETEPGPQQEIMKAESP